MIEILSPFAGWITPLADVPDPVFATSMLGGGIAVDPAEGLLCAPGTGTVLSVHEAGHAVTLSLDSGPVLLLHIGLDTVALGGAGFEPACRAGDAVSAGQPLIRFDLDLLARKARSLVTPIVVTNEESFAIRKTAVPGVATQGSPVLWLERRAGAHDSPNKASKENAIERRLVLSLAHGLHARPAARVAALAAEFDADCALVAEDGRSASARSPVAMLALSLRHGDALTLSGSGAQAEAALAALAELIESGMGEHLPVTPKSMPLEDAPVVLPSSLTGVTAVAGTAIGPAHPITVAAWTPPKDAADAQDERAALAAALAHVHGDLEQAQTGDGPLAAIAAAHSALLGDPELERLAHEAIAAGRSAGFAWQAAIESFAEPLRASKDRRFAERVADLEDLSQQVLAVLSGGACRPAKPAPGAILVSMDILPSQLMALADAGLAGLATGAGGASSHVAIIAAGLGLPMLSGLGPAVSAIAPGTELMIHDGRLSIEPDAEARACAQRAVATEAALIEAAKDGAHEPAITRDGQHIEVFANLGSVEDARRAAAAGAEGCGLLRTEFLFLDRAARPSRDEQRVAYRAISEALGPRPIIVRTLDIGADKPVGWLAQPEEENPALGKRGIRLQLAVPDLLADQLAALVEADMPGELRIMLPMVSELSELVETRVVLEKVCAAAGKPVPELGIMVETPAAALLSATLSGAADFFSIGSNDLSQYTLARDRTAASVAAGLDALHPAVLRLIAETVAGAEKHGRWTGLCGALAADRLAVPILIGLGVSELSVPPKAVALVKHVVRGLDIAACRDLAAAALDAPDAASVRALSARFLEARP